MNRARMLVSVSLLIVPILASASHPLVLNGEILIQNDGSRAVQAFIQPDSTGITHVVRLSAEGEFAQNPLSFHLARGRVIVRDSRVTILDGDGKLAVVLALLEAPDVHVDIDEPRMAREKLAGGADRAVLRDATVLRGYGLAIQKITPGQYIATVRRPREVASSQCIGCVENPDPGGGSGSGASGCDSGGTGSTSCSCSGGVGSCSTTCSAGYYACCKGCTNNNPTCSCVPIR